MEKENEKRCDVCKNKYFERNNYFCGKLMTVRDFFAEQCYFNEKRWLINRMVHGWGVVCGLKVYEQDGKVFVTPGLAIDCCGREILVCGKDQEVRLVPEESECHKEQAAQGQEVEKLVICIEYQDCKTEALHLPPIACDQKERCEFNRIRDSFKISAVLFQEPGPQQTPLCPQTSEEKAKSLHLYLCDRLREGCPECPNSECVILATVTVDQSGNLEIDPCSRRKLVYSNPLLYDLIDCFHGTLPHVEKINWPKPVDEPLSWGSFKNLMRNDGLQVTFDRDMNDTTLNENTVLFMIKERESGTGYMLCKYVPPADIKYDVRSKTVTYKPTADWIIEVLEGSSAIKDYGGECTMTLRGDHIQGGEDNRALDGNFIGGNLPSGNGVEGGDFVSMFFVEPKSATKRKPRPKPKPRSKPKT